MLPFECIKCQNYTCVKINSNINQFNSKIMEDQVNLLIEIGEKNIIIDLSDINFLDSSGIGVLVRSTKKASQSSGKLVIINKSSTIEGLFSMSNLSNLVNFVGSITEAEKFFET